MLELTLKPQFTVVIPPKLLQEGYLVTFPESWPSTLTHVRGKTFRIEACNQVPYDLNYILPEEDYRDVDFSNGSGDYEESCYPEKTESLFEVAMGLGPPWEPDEEPPNYLVHFYIPADRHIHYLEYAGMTPLVTSSTLRYLGARKPKDSPYNDPRIKLYFVKDLTPLIARVYVLPGVDYEKCVLGLTINKCRLREITEPTEEQKLKAKVIRYYDEFRW